MICPYNRCPLWTYCETTYLYEKGTEIDLSNTVFYYSSEGFLTRMPDVSDI